MTFRTCVLDNIDKNHKRRAEAEAVLEQYDSRVTELRNTGMDEARAEEAAAAEFVEKKTEENGWVKARRIKSAVVQTRQVKRVMESNNPAGKVGDIFAEIEGVSSGYLKHFHAMLNKFLTEYDTQFMGSFRNKAGLGNILKELYGVKTQSSAAKGYAESIKKMYAETTKLARANGINMVDDPLYHAPQRHSPGRMGKAGKTTWVKDHMEDGVLDWDHMKSFNDGKVIDPSEREGVLQRAYDTITREGLNKVTFDHTLDASVGARLTQRRFLRYQTPEAWEKMQDSYGDGSLADSLIEHMTSISQDLAQLHVLGPNPSANKAALERSAKVRTNEMMDALPEKGHAEAAAKLRKKMTRGLAVADEIYGLVSGRLSGIDTNRAATALATVRTIIPGAFLGKAVLSALPGDLMTMKHAAYFSGHTTMDPVSRYLKMINPASSADRAFAKRSGVIMDLVMANLTTAERFGGDALGPKWARHLTEGSLRATGLSHHTEMARWATTMELYGDYAANAKKSFDELPFKDRFERQGITAEDWDLLRGTDQENFKGATFLRPRDMFAAVDTHADVVRLESEIRAFGPDNKKATAPLRKELAALRNDLTTQADVAFTKFSTYEHDFLELAVPTASVQGKAALLGGTRPGTVSGEIARSAAMFKNFPITIMMKHWREALRQSTGTQRVKYLTSFIAMLTAAGAVSEQMHTLSKGEDLQNMNPFENPKFYAKSLARGGGLSLLADFLVSDVNRYGDGFFESTIGPVASFLDDISAVTYGQVQKAFDDTKETDFMLNFAQMVRRYTPGGHTWYADLAINGLFGELVLENIDPEFHSKAQYKVNKLFTEKNREYYWKPGALTPERAPSADNVLGR